MQKRQPTIERSQLNKAQQGRYRYQLIDGPILVEVALARQADGLYQIVTDCAKSTNRQLSLPERQQQKAKSILETLRLHFEQDLRRAGWLRRFTPNGQRWHLP